MPTAEQSQAGLAADQSQVATAAKRSQVGPTAKRRQAEPSANSQSNAPESANSQVETDNKEKISTDKAENTEKDQHKKQEKYVTVPPSFLLSSSPEKDTSETKPPKEHDQQKQMPLSVTSPPTTHQHLVSKKTGQCEKETRKSNDTTETTSEEEKHDAKEHEHVDVCIEKGEIEHAEGKEHIKKHTEPSLFSLLSSSQGNNTDQETEELNQFASIHTSPKPSKTKPTSQKAISTLFEKTQRETKRAKEKIEKEKKDKDRQERESEDEDEIMQERAVLENTRNKDKQEKKIDVNQLLSLTTPHFTPIESLSKPIEILEEGKNNMIPRYKIRYDDGNDYWEDVEYIEKRDPDLVMRFNTKKQNQESERKVYETRANAEEKEQREGKRYLRCRP